MRLMETEVNHQTNPEGTDRSEAAEGEVEVGECRARSEVGPRSRRLRERLRWVYKEGEEEKKLRGGNGAGEETSREGRRAGEERPRDERISKEHGMRILTWDHGQEGQDP
ncbi:uncharacterized protein A4U43_C03F2730 [Asparagus officinalis]|uniref:Uncharacterized protein n=1 Tax=Asparagus officinalis TaxID=4686 RepID=A0A5P1F6T9_ASPOF|nr:uncharacterized protein A4U43_C03F2730 [Asparagus officinalis]